MSEKYRESLIEKITELLEKLDGLTSTVKGLASRIELLEGDAGPPNRSSPSASLPAPNVFLGISAHSALGILERRVAAMDQDLRSLDRAVIALHARITARVTTPTQPEPQGPLKILYVARQPQS